jgi:predicted dienelactone hydrolase
MKRRIKRAAWLLAVGWATLTCAAQRTVSIPREDGHATPLMIYEPTGAGKQCAPLALISHGAGGTERGYRYLADGMAKMGYEAVVMGHRESGPGVLGSSVMAQGVQRGVQQVVEDRNAETARLRDVGAALKWADAQCKAPGKIPFRVLLGHSMGAETVLLEAGARNQIGVTSPPAGLKRFDAYVALSPEGPGIVFPDRAWTDVRVPVLMLTGTLDREIQAGPEERLIPWKEMPGAKGGCQWLGVIDGARHMNFSGNGVEAERVTALTVATIDSFLAGARRGRCALPPATAGIVVTSK